MTFDPASATHHSKWKFHTKWKFHPKSATWPFFSKFPVNLDCVLIATPIYGYYILSNCIATILDDQSTLADVELPYYNNGWSHQHTTWHYCGLVNNKCQHWQLVCAHCQSYIQYTWKQSHGCLNVAVRRCFDTPIQTHN